MNRDDNSGDAHDNEMDTQHQKSEKLDLNVEQNYHSQNIAHFRSQHPTQPLSANGALALGIEFESDEHAYRLYNKYARLLGFSVRKDWVNRSKVHGQVVSRKFTCSKEGYRRKDKRDINVKKHRKETRTGCMAHMIITRQSDGKYKVTQLEVQHNHDNINTCNAQILLLQEELCVAGTNLPGNLKTQTGLVFEETSKRLGIRECLDDLVMDRDNHLQSGRVRDMNEGEAGRLMHYFQRQHFENPSFFYAVQLDADDKVTNVFWADDNMIADYGHFGDVVCLDTTCRTNKDFQPFVQFIGLNNHNQVMVFAAALLFDDTIESLKWLFHTLLEAMSGKKPKVSLTVQDATIVEAINSVLPETNHRICVWQMYQNALKHLAPMVKDVESFASDFRSCIYDHRDEEEFIRAWNIMLDRYSLQQNEWLRWMFREREKWAVVYGRNTFFMDMENIHMGEVLSDNLRKYLNSDQELVQFLRIFERVVDELRCREMEANDEMYRCMPKLMANVVLLKHASEIYTPEAFEVFQREYERSLNVVVNKSSQTALLSEYTINTYGQAREYTVNYNASDDSIICNCMKFEDFGFLCSHALKVLDHRNIKVLPSRYILKRWTRDARTGDKKECEDSNGIEEEENSRLAVAKRYKNLCQSLVKLSARASESEEAFSFASRKLNEVIEGVEKILTLRPDNSNASESGNDEIFMDGNASEYHNTEKIGAKGNEKDGDLPDRSKLKIVSPKGSKKRIRNLQTDSPNTVTCISSSPSSHVSPPSRVANPVMQNLYGFGVNQLPQCVYEQPNLVVEQQPNIGIYPQPNFYNDRQDSPNQTPLMQAMELDIQHPHSSSFLIYDQRYRTSETTYLERK